MFEEIKFATVSEAIQHLSDVTGQKIIIAGTKVTPRKNDIAVIVNPKDHIFYVFRMNDENIKPGGFFQEDELLETHPFSMDFNKLDLLLDVKYGLHPHINTISSMTKKELEETIPRILLGWKASGDKYLEAGSFQFETDRDYEEITSLAKRLQRIKKKPSRAKDRIKQYQESTFGSVDEALQFLADHTNCKIEIEN